MSRIVFSITFLAVFIATNLGWDQAAFGEEGIFLDLPIGLKIGETANIDSDLKMTLLDIEDSRCPSDVVCVWQGTVSAKIQLEKGEQDLGIHTISMETIEENEQTFDGYYIRLTNVEPYPVSTTPINPTDYSITFFISKAGLPTIDSPLKQFRNGVPYNEIKCNSGLQLTQRYDGRPACVKDDTYFELIKRGWVSEIIIATQSRNISDTSQD